MERTQLGEFVVRLATSEDTMEVLHLMRACFGEREAINDAWYQWFNYGCPTGPNRNYVAIDKQTGRFAGGYGLLPIRIKINNEVVDGSLCTNVMAHPDYQGRGLFTSMGRYCLSAEEAFGARATLGVPNENAYPGHMKVGWKLLSNLAFVAKSSFRDRTCKSVEVAAFDSRVDHLIRQTSQQVNFIVEKDYRFLNWRYTRRPGRAYRLFVFEDDGDVGGYMVLKYFDGDGGRKVHILDVAACTQEAFDDLVLTAERASSGRDELNCWQIGHSIYEEFFSGNGFAKAGKEDVLIMRTNFGNELVPESSNWWFCLGDNDVY